QPRADTWPFVEELCFVLRKSCDQNMKALCRAGKHITAIDNFTGLMEPLDDVKTLLASKQKE
ncbi:MAG: hypothetical protein ACKPKO_29610, partial [Candidatus Fonsibacter sp.]